MSKKALLAGGALISLMAAAATPALAQSDLDEVVVTASRLNRADVPTPIYAVTSEALKEAARPNVFAALNDLPQFRGTAAPQVGGSLFAGTGNYAPDLRGLGPTRTLTLVDGRRLVTGYENPDFSAVPNLLIKRVDVITGSASAAWGSNAVAGVVNIILDDRFEGTRIGAQYGVSDRGDAVEKRFEAAFGRRLLDDKARFVFGAEFIDSGSAGARAKRKNVGRWAVVTNPDYTATNGQKPLMRTPDVGYADASLGGLILSGVNRGKTFNPDGTTSNFNFGRVVGNTSIGAGAPANDDFIQLAAPATRYNLLGRFVYDISPALSVTAELRHSRAYNNFPIFIDPNRGNITISIENPFLPEAIRQQMRAAGETSFTMGRFNSDIALINVDFSRKTTQATLALDGKLGDTFKWSAYYSHGWFHDDSRYSNQRVVANFNLATDAVMGPNNQPICRSTLTNPNNGCVPINLFGFNSPSLAARAYVLGTSVKVADVSLDTVGFTLRGEPVSLWAGPVSVALGVEGRRERVDQTVGAQDTAKAFGFFNATAYAGKNTTKEAFGEILLPVLKDLPGAKLLQFNGAARITDDRTGSIWSWKLGALNQVMDGLQLRATHSRDIRAPNLGDLYSPLFGPGIGQILDPQLGITYSIGSFNGGNPNLKPETSRTTTLGFTATPAIVPSLRVSVDYFDIRIDNAIGTITPQNAVNLCAKGNQTLCSTVQRGADGRITFITANSINFTEFKTSGVDLVVDYVVPTPFPGDVRLRSAITWNREFKTNDGLATMNYLASQGDIRASLGVPRMVANTAVYYETSKYQAYVRGRYLSSGYFDRTRQIQNNRIPAYMYVDVGGTLTIPVSGQAVELSANVANLLNKAPPVASLFSPYYDVVGRYMSVALRWKF